MGVREALAKLSVPPVPPAQFGGGTAKVQQPCGGSPGSPGSPANTRGLEVTPDEERRRWADELLSDLHGWLSVHSFEVWCAADIGERITPQWKRLDALLEDYERTGELGDRKAAVFAANAVAQVAARTAREWEASR